MLKVIRVDFDCAGMAAGRQPRGRCEHPFPFTSGGRVVVEYCSNLVQDAAVLDGISGIFTRYLCRDHAKEYQQHLSR